MQNVPADGVNAEAEFAIEFSAGLTANGPDNFGSANAQISGDPHIKRWNQKKRNTYHGECDLVFIEAESFQVLQVWKS